MTMPRGLLLAILIPLSACSVGNGDGRAVGNLFIQDCSSDSDYCSGDVCGTPTAPAPYDLHPDFFAGEPFNVPQKVISVQIPQERNRLTIRMQRSGKRIEQNDVVTFQVADEYEVARCVRGGTLPNGDPDYDPRYCFHATPDTPAKIRITSAGGIILASFMPRMTCSRNVVASAYDTPSVDDTASIPSDGSFDSWITFETFGSARLDPASPPTSLNFKVNMEERVQASAFHLVLVDSQVIDDLRGDLPVQSPTVGGILDGYFDFDVVRGQGAQFFP